MNSCVGNLDSQGGENLRLFKFSTTKRLFGIPKFLPGDGFLEFVKLLKLLDNLDASSAA